MLMDIARGPGGAATAEQALDGAAAAQQAVSAAVIPFGRYRDFGARWPIPARGEVLVVPLGGLGRIGMNWTLYGTDGAWLLVDAGIAFPDKGVEGVDAIIPDPAFLEPILPRLAGLVVTHAHEDHIGAIDKVWPQAVNCPIHATPFAAGILARRFEEAGTLRRIDLRTYPVGGSFEVGPFRIRSVRMTHSIPEPVLLAIGTGAGTVVHSGDWKFDPEPLVGEATDFDALREIGDAGVLALLADSTNAHKELPTTSEAQVRAAFERIFASRRGQVVVCCFATNVARVASAAVAAVKAGRKVALAGRSMRNCEETARKVGLLKGVPEFLGEPGHLKGLDRREVAMVCTGTQGEERAALARLARGDRRLPLLERGDTVVLSSRVIPGNEGEVDAIVSKLRKRGVEVVRSDTVVDGFPVHVSGHPGRGELREMYGLLRPRFAVPVHGHIMHQEAHASLARECGAERAVILEESEVVRLTPSGISVEGRVDVPLLHIARDENGDAVPVAPRRLAAAE